MKRIALIMSAVFLWPFAANADIDYNYAQADFIVDGEFDAGGFGEDDYDGWGLEGSVGLTPALFLQGSYNDLSFDSGGDTELLSLGVGARMALGGTQGDTDAYGVLSYEDIDVGNIADANGLGLTAGMRWNVTPGMELNPSIAYLDYGNVDGINADLDGWRFGLRGVFNLTDQIALNAEWRNYSLELSGGGSSVDFDLDNEIRLGARFYWM